MSECTCHKNYTLDTLVPQVGIITDIRQETPDVKTFRVNAPEGGKLFEHMSPDSARWSAHRVSVKVCFPLRLHLPIKNIRNLVSKNAEC